MPARRTETSSTFMYISPLSPEQWADVRRRRAAGASFTALAAQVGLKPKTIAQRARSEGWPRPGTGPRSETRPQAISSKPADHLDAAGSLDPVRSLLSAHLASSTAQVRRAFNRRFFRILELELMLVELRMQKRLEDARQNKDAPIASSEADLRSTQSVMKTVSEATEPQPDTDPKSRGGGKSRSAAGPSEADIFRREIAERLEKLIPPS
jgi:hypothetical protein